MALVETTVKSFKTDKGYGFFENPNGGEDIFFYQKDFGVLNRRGRHINDPIPGSELPLLSPGMKAYAWVAPAKKDGRPRATRFAIDKVSQ